MGMELIPGYLSIAKGGRFYESEIYNDDLNRESVKKFAAEFNRALFEKFQFYCDSMLRMKTIRRIII